MFYENINVVVLLTYDIYPYMLIKATQPL